MPLPALVTPEEQALWTSGDPAFRLAAATAMVRAYCRWHIAPSITETVTVPAGVGYLTMLPTLYLTDVEDLLVDGVAVDMVPAEPAWWSQNGYIRHVAGWQWWYTDLFRTVTVTMTHGYDEVPDDLKAVVLALAGDLESTFSGATEVRIDDAAVSYGTDRLSTAHRNILDAYRIILC